MTVVGVTGVIASGKTEASGLLARAGFTRLDADMIARKVLSGTRTVRSVKKAFGPDVVRRGRIDRQALADAVFVDKRNVARLNAIVHPAVVTAIRRRVRAARRAHRHVVVDAPLLIEAGLADDCDRVIVVNAARSVRKRRALKRGCLPGAGFRREKYQLSFKEKKRYADFIVHNNGTKQELRKKILKILGQITP